MLTRKERKATALLERFIPDASVAIFSVNAAPLCERGASDGDAHARRLPGDPAFLCDRFGRGDDAARDETWPAFVLAREDEDRIAFGDVLATIHRLLRAERERLRPRIANLGFDREYHTPHLAPLIPWPSMGPGLTAELSDAGGPALPDSQQMRPARIRSSDFVRPRS